MHRTRGTSQPLFRLLIERHGLAGLHSVRRALRTEAERRGKRHLGVPRHGRQPAENDDGKARRWRHGAIASRLGEMARIASPWRRQGTVLPSLAGKSGSGKSGLSMAFKKIMERAGIVGEIARQGHGAGRTTSTLSFHSTRHFFVSALSAGGVPADVRQRLAGHTDVKMHAVYAAHEMNRSLSVRELSTDELRTARRAVPFVRENPRELADGRKGEGAPRHYPIGSFWPSHKKEIPTRHCHLVLRFP